MYRTALTSGEGLLASDELHDANVIRGSPTLTLGEHPETGMTCWFLHPCETQSALAPLRETNDNYIAAFVALVSTAVSMECG